MNLDWHDRLAEQGTVRGRRFCAALRPLPRSGYDAVMPETTFEVQLGSCFYGGLEEDAVYVGRKDGDSGWISVCEEHKQQAEEEGYELMEPKESGEVSQEWAERETTQPEIGPEATESRESDPEAEPEAAH